MEAVVASALEEQLKEKFGEAVLSVEQLDMPCYTVQREKIVDIIQWLYDSDEHQFRFLTTVAGLHYPFNAGKELGVMYQLHSFKSNQRIRIKIFFPVGDPHVATLTTLYATANWMEREGFDFYGIIFDGHPNLKRILNVEDMEFFPMRKEFPLEDPTREDKDDTMFGR